MEKFFIESLALELLEEVRVLPGKRYVCRAQKSGQEVYVKFFYGKSSERYFNREKTGLELLANNNFLGPVLIESGTIEGSSLPQGWTVNANASYLITEKVPGRNLLDLWQSSSEKKALLKQLVAQLSEYHQAGILQGDTHFGNFMIHEDKIACLDGDGVRKSKSDQKQLENLALMCAQTGFYCPLTNKEIIGAYGKSIQEERFSKIGREIFFNVCVRLSL